MKTLLLVFVFLVIGGVAIWYVRDQRRDADAHAAVTQLESATKSAGGAIDDELRRLKLEPNDIKDELARTGRVIREKAESVGHQVADAATDARITTTIKAKFMASRELSPLKISVNTDAGVVTLGGSVRSTDDVSHAMAMAMDTDGVAKVISSLKVQGEGSN
jgi:osmotically-inducible protein OsmY